METQAQYKNSLETIKETFYQEIDCHNERIFKTARQIVAGVEQYAFLGADEKRDALIGLIKPLDSRLLISGCLNQADELGYGVNLEAFELELKSTQSTYFVWLRQEIAGLIYNNCLSETFKTRTLGQGQDWLPASPEEVRMMLRVAGLTQYGAGQYLGLATKKKTKSCETVKRWITGEKPIPYPAWALICFKAGFGNIFDLETCE